MNWLLSAYLRLKHTFPNCYRSLKRFPAFRRLCRFLRFTVLKNLYDVTATKGSGHACLLPWGSAAIRADGTVTCSTAHRSRKELFFGNICESSFMDVWHGEKLQVLRRSIMNGEGKLPYLCFTCPYKVKREDMSGLSLKPAFPKVLWVESADGCNLRCPGCIHPDDRRNSFLPMERYKGLIDELGPRLETILFYLDGENYLHPNATEMTRYAKQVNPGVRITTSTNGLLFDTPSKREDFVLSGVDTAIFSIDGATQDSYTRYRKGGNLEVALENMRAVVKLKTRLDIPLHVQWRYILFEWNDSEREMDHARRLALETGVDSLAWLITATLGRSRRYIPQLAGSYRKKIPPEHFEVMEAAAKEEILGQKFV